MNTEESKSIIKRLYRSPRYYGELLLKVKTKDAEIRALFYNKAQLYLYSVVQKLRLAKRPVRIITVKARQVGMSTGISSIIYQHTSTRKNITSMVSSHDQDSSENIYRMYKMFYDYTDDFFKPMTQYSNRKELVFENPNEKLRKANPGLNSRIVVQTAKNTNIGRSFTVHNFHGSEVAFWYNPDEVLTSVKEAVPEKAGTSIYLESTANGMGNFFHRECERAARGKSEYKLIFVPWFWDLGYAVPESELRLSTLGDYDKCEYGDELYMMKTFGLTRGQMQWRRNKINSSFEGNVDRFHQEYPSTWEEAFIFSGQPMFSSKIVVGMRDLCESADDRHEITFNTGKKDFGFGLQDSTSGCLQIWEHPVSDQTYTLGADVAEGVEGGNNSVVEILCANTMTQVAEWTGIIPPDEFAYVVYFMGKMYGMPLAGVEVNNHGLTTIVKLEELRYWNQYRRIVYDTSKKKRMSKIGWKTTAQTKPLIVDGLRKVIREGEVIINSWDLCDEMLSFVKHDDGTMGATSGKMDDRVIAMAIAVEMARQTYVRMRPKKKEKLKPGTMSYGRIDDVLHQMDEANKLVLPLGYERDKLA